MEMIVTSKKQMDVKMDAVRIRCAAVCSKDGLESRSDCVKDVSSRLKGLIESLKDPRFNGVQVDLGGISVQPKYQILESTSGGSKRTSHKQDGWTATGLVSVLIQYGTCHLDSVGAVAESHGFHFSAYYELSKTTRRLSECALRSALLGAAMQQAADLLKNPDGTQALPGTLEVTKIIYGGVKDVSTRSYMQQERCASFGGLPEFDDEADVHSHDLDLIYARENAPSVTLDDEITVYFDLKGEQ